LSRWEADPSTCEKAAAATVEVGRGVKAVGWKMSAAAGGLSFLTTVSFRGECGGR
jgi:hypothetical protein